jgi:hypothetical protein
MREELPFDYEDGSQISNSEMALKCWHIEDPWTKELVKKLVVKLTPGSEKELIIVMKAPNDRPQYNLASFLSLRPAFDGAARKRNMHLEKRLKSMDDEHLHPEDINMDII